MKIFQPHKLFLKRLMPVINIVTIRRLKSLHIFFWYRIVATPIAFLYTKIAFHHKVCGRERLKAFKKKGYFVYGNHTQPIGDAVIPTLVNMPKDVYTIVHPNNVSMPYLGKVTPSMGALPLPDDMKATQNFIKAIERRVLEQNVIMIYPEAHIWPFYTKIRPFGDEAFRYPIKYDVPTFCLTNTYQKRKWSEKPKLITYVDGPFYPDESLGMKEKKRDLRDKVYQCMCERSKMSTVEHIKYIKKDVERGNN